MKKHHLTSRRLLTLTCFALLLAGSTQAYSTGIGGDEDGNGDVAVAGCTCHSESPDNSVTLQDIQKLEEEIRGTYETPVSYMIG